MEDLPRNPLPFMDQPREESRHTGRIRCELLTCELGEVVNLSASGMKVRGQGKRDCVQFTDGEVVDLNLHLLDNTLPIRAKIVWASVDKFPSYQTWEAGLEFVEMSDRAREALREIARAAISIGLAAKVG